MKLKDNAKLSGNYRTHNEMCLRVKYSQSHSCLRYYHKESSAFRAVAKANAPFRQVRDKKIISCIVGSSFSFLFFFIFQYNIRDFLSLCINYLLEAYFSSAKLLYYFIWHRRVGTLYGLYMLKLIFN